MKMNLKLLKKLRMGTLILAASAAGICYSCGPRNGEEQEIVLETASGYGGEEAEESSSEKSSSQEMTSSGQSSCFVHVCGQVNAPGVYELEAGSRIYQAVEMAGGFGADAAVWYLNLAQEITDGMKIQVPSVQEAEQWEQTGGPRADSQWEASQEMKVNLNTADKEQLMTLTGIGESRAEDIIRYRQEHGPFERIEDIMNVSGIKEGAFQKIKDSITV